MNLAATQGGPGRIASLDGLRAVAILCVVWHHAMMTVDLDQPWLRRTLALSPSGDFGVQIFFVLSGFLISTLLLREQRKNGSISLRDFYRRRAYRIFPALYVFLGIVALLMIFKLIDLQVYVLAAAALFIRNYVPTDGSWWLGHTWTLAVEGQFYLLWPLALGLLPKRHVAKALVGAIVAVALMRVFTWLLIPQLKGGVMVMFHTRADALLVGCLLAVVWHRTDFQYFLNRQLGRGLGWAALAWMPFSWIAHHELGDAWKFTVGYLGDALAIATVMAWAILRPHRLGGRVLNNPVMSHIGAISFSLYLYQQLFLTSFNHSILGAFGLNVVLAFAAAELSYRLVEQPFLRLRDGKKKRAETPGRHFGPHRSPVAAQ